MTKWQAARLGWQVVLIEHSGGRWWNLLRDGQTVALGPFGRPGWNTKSEALTALCKGLREGVLEHGS